MEQIDTKEDRMEKTIVYKPKRIQPKYNKTKQNEPQWRKAKPTQNNTKQNEMQLKLKGGKRSKSKWDEEVRTCIKTKETGQR